MAQASALQLITIQAVYWQRCKWTAIFTIIFFSLRLLLSSYNSSLNEKVFHQKLIGVGQHPPSPLVGWWLIFFSFPPGGSKQLRLKIHFQTFQEFLEQKSFDPSPFEGEGGVRNFLIFFPILEIREELFFCGIPCFCARLSQILA